jgi:hypothetical protein
VIPFLSEVLNDPKEEVWKQAIDGLVTIGSPEAVKSLRAARERHFSSPNVAKDFCGWIDEAIQQITDKNNLLQSVRLQPLSRFSNAF